MSFEFQLLDIDHFHDDDDNGDVIYKIRLFGKTRSDKSVYLEVNGFKPYFFVEVDSNWTKNQINRIIEQIKKKVYPKNYVNGYLTYELVEQYKFWGFTNYKKFNFIKLFFNSYDSMLAYNRAFSKRQKINYMGKNKIKFNIYESNINPILRFLHIKELNAVGWCSIKDKHLVKFNNYEPAITDYSYKVHWTNINPVDSNDIHKFSIMSFDLECTSKDGSFPQATRLEDKIIQIGMTFSRCGETECYKKLLLSLKQTDDVEGVDVRSYQTEKELLLDFCKLIKETDPDIITGYNIYGFDFPYLKDRATLLGIYPKFSRLSRLKNHICKFQDKQLQSAALGINKLQYYEMPGRISIDLMKVAQRDFKLGSYKLDYVASHFIRDKIVSFKNKKNKTKLVVSSIFGIKVGQYISIYYNDGITDNNVGDKKYLVKKIGNYDNNFYITVDDPSVDLQEYLDKKYKVYWCQAKDDVTPQQIFDSYTGTSYQRAVVGKYCVQDCELCNRLIGKLSILTNNIGMANVCHVPLSYLFLRGQGVKIFSLVAKKCRQDNHLIPVIKKKRKTDEEKKSDDMDLKNFNKFNKFFNKNNNYNNYNNYSNNETETEESDDEGYEGATVFEPNVGVHYKHIIVLDFASLYPNSMILKNLSHESFVMDDKYDNLPDYNYHEIQYKKHSGEIVTCRFAEKKDGTKSIIPKILQDLLATRKKYKKLKAVENDAFIKSIYDGLQLAYKVTANSLYGQTGASTSPICMKVIAASTTATGRDMLQYAKYFIEDIYAKIIKLSISNKHKKFIKYMNSIFQDIPDEKLMDEKKNISNRVEFYEWIYKRSQDLLDEYTIDPKVIYGDTDSVFFCMNMIDKKTGQVIQTQEYLKLAIDIGIFASDIVNTLMKKPMNLEYEKVLWPFVILTKKRYVGNLYEFDPNKYHQKSMGIVLKRRDNAPIVKVVVGGIIDKIIARDPVGAVKLTQDTLQKIITGKYNIDKFIITKTLKSLDSYKDWTRLPHAVLANRMSIRDPGNAPQSNDRIPFAYIEVKHKVNLQGDRVEHPNYITENNLKLDYLFYITNQIMKPAIQFLELIVENPEDIFKDYIIKEKNRQKGIKPICAMLSNNDGDNKEIINMDDLIDFNNMDDLIDLHTECKTRKTKKNSKTNKTKKKEKKKVIIDDYNNNNDDIFNVGLW
jgi:DNA polymerase elongation subunit (family B)